MSAASYCFAASTSFPCLILEEVAVETVDYGLVGVVLECSLVVLGGLHRFPLSTEEAAVVAMSLELTSRSL